jgi:hypothetical protein
MVNPIFEASPYLLAKKFILSSPMLSLIALKQSLGGLLNKFRTLQKVGSRTEYPYAISYALKSIPVSF